MGSLFVGGTVEGPLVKARPVNRSAAAGVRRFSTVVAAALITAVLAASGFAAGDDISSKDVIDAVVGISTMIPEDARTAEHLGTIRSGSGIVIDGDGLVLTIGYLMMEATTAAVTDATGKLVPAVPVAYDHNTGFGLLRAQQPLGVKPVELGSSVDLAEGANVVVISKGGPIPVMPARVASRREFAGYWEYLLEKAIFTVPPHPSYGGAALIGPDGRLVGIGSLVVSDAIPALRPVPGNMFVPIDRLKPIMAELLEKGRVSAPRHPWLGVYSNEKDGRVFVTRVAADGPADVAGIKPGDIIMGVGGNRIKNVADFYRKIWARGEAGTEVPIDLLPAGRGEIKIVKVTVSSQDRYDWLKLNRGL